MKNGTLNLPAAKSPEKVRSYAQSPTVVGLSGKSASKAAPGPRTVKTQQRREAQRVLLRVKARVHVALQGQPTTIDVATLSVNPSGALVLMKQGLPAETRLVLEHQATRERVACKVAGLPREMPEGFHVPLEFDAPSPTFWKIDFPPTDWRPEDL